MFFAAFFGRGAWGGMRDRGDQISALTGLRFVAALSVALAHATSFIAIPGLRLDYWMQSSAAFGMTLFFVLSGFVIHYNYRSIAGSASEIARFFWIRFARLYPLFVLVLLIDILLGPSVGSYLAGKSEGMDHILGVLLRYLTLTQSWIYSADAEHSLIFQLGNLTSITWSISTEWFFYLAFPALVPLILRLKTPAFIMLAALLIPLCWGALDFQLFSNRSQIDAWALMRYGPVAATANGIVESFLIWLVAFSPYLRIGEFLMGCLAAQLYLVMRDRAISARELAIGRILLLSSILAIVVFIYLKYSSPPSLWNSSVSFGLAPFVAILIFCSARYRTAFSRLMSTRPMLRLGDASYSIYLLHMFVYTACGQAQPILALHELDHPILMLSLVLARFAFVILLVLIIALGAHAFVEAPARRWLRSLWPEKQRFSRTAASDPAARLARS